VNDLPELLGWLKEERDKTGEGFYCNKNVIENSFKRDEGLCAIENGRIVGFAVIQMFSKGGDVHIVEAHPSARRQRIGSQLLDEAIAVLRGQGAHYVDVECTSPEGEALCRKHGFEDYIDPRNHRSPYANPKLRLYLSDWRPPVRLPWA
jgi:ribosomal protein S18 acetylase RimI-like enzyme